MGTLFGGITEELATAACGAIRGRLDRDVFVKAKDILVAQILNILERNNLRGRRRPAAASAARESFGISPQIKRPPGGLS
jgi:hypothetical protein